MKKRSILFVFAFLLFCSAGIAQNVLRLSLDEAQQYALQNNLNMKNADLAIQKSRQAEIQALASGLPQVSATMDYSNAFGASMSLRFSEDMPPNEIAIANTSNLNVSLSQMVFNGSYFVNLQISKISTILSNLQKEQSELDIKENVYSSYMVILAYEEIKRLTEQNLANLQETYEKTKKMYEVGVAEEIDVKQLSVQLSTLQNTIHSYERQIELSERTFKMVLGIDAETNIELTQTFDEFLNNTEMENTLQADFNINNNINIKSLQQQKELSEKQLTLQKAAYLPTINGTVTYTYKVLTSNFDMSPPFMLMLNMNIPIFSSGSRKSSVKQARIDLETAENQLSYQKQQLAVQEQQLRFDLSTAYEQYLNQKQNVDISMEVYENNQDKYQQGIMSSLDLTTANSNYLSAEMNYINAALSVIQANISLKKLLGTL